MVGGANTTSLAAGVISAVTAFGKEEDTLEKHYTDTIAGGVGVNDKALVRTMVNDLPKYMNRLMEYGIEFDGGETPKPRFVPGHNTPRSYFIDGAGVRLQSILKKYTEVLGVRSLERTTITSLVRWGERVVGAVGYKADTGEVVAIKANATIIATGGPGELYPKTLNPTGSTGYGSSLGLRAGAEVVDMEFVQFYPMMVYETGLPRIFIDYSPLLKYGAIVRNSQGEDIMKKRGIMEPYRLTRDVFSVIVYQEMSAPTGDKPIYLDCTPVPEASSDAWVSGAMKSLEAKGIPVSKRKIGISPYAHFFMGGLKADSNGATSLPALFATGEAMGGIHGANRIGGNALAACLVFGFRSGLAASLCAGTVTPAPEEPFIEPSSWIREALDYSGLMGSNLDLVKSEIQALVWEKVGIVRRREGLEEALARFNQLRGKVFKSSDPLEGFLLPMMLDTAEVTCLGALLRDESRGSHFREDATETKTSWEKRIVLKLCEGKCEVRYDPV
jgi:fumarate reductase (CoM/CoB) subunit A